MLKRILKISGIDEAILWSILNKVLSVIKGPISLYFLVRYLTPDVQGVWFTFGSLGALTIFAELGFLTIITQFVSHEFAYLRVHNGKIVGEEKNVDRLFGLINFSLKFYILIVPIAILILCIIGFFFFAKEESNVRNAWYLFSVVGGTELILSLMQSIYTGLNNVKQGQINLFICVFLSSIANWVMLMLKLSIWALVFGNLLGIIIASILLYISAKDFWTQLVKYKVLGKYNFLKETLPLQGRYAISWISAFFILYLLVPAVYRFETKEIAGQVGMTIALISAVTGVSNAWIITKVPIINIMVEKKSYTELDSMFRKTMLQSIIIQTLLFLILIGAMLFVKKNILSYSNRFLDVHDTLLLMIPQFTQLLSIFFSVYLRAHKKDPMMWISVIQAALILLAVVLGLSQYHLRTFLYILNIIYICFVLPSSYYVFRRKLAIYKLHNL